MIWTVVRSMKLLEQESLEIRVAGIEECTRMAVEPVTKTFQSKKEEREPISCNRIIEML